MKIIQPISFDFPVKTPQIINCRRNDNEKDVFTSSKSVQTLNFKSNSPNIYKKILESPSLSQKFMGLVSAAAAALIGAAQLKDDESEVVDKNLFNMLLGISKHSSSVADLESQIEVYKEENKKLKQKIKKLESENNIENIQKSNETDIQEETKNVVFTFPKKWGKYSAAQRNLKEATNGINLSQQSYEKLLKICTQALLKGSISDDKVNQFAVSISNAENKEPIIDEFYLNLFEEEQSLSNEQENKSLLATVKGTTYRKSEILQKDPFVDRAILYKVPSVYSNNIYDAIDSLMKKFQQEIYNNYKAQKKENIDGLCRPRWKYNKPVAEHILVDDIKTEIEKKGFSKDSGYTRITKEEPEFLADIINSDSRFHSLFTVHSALRLLERYVNFDSDKHPIEQCHVILDKIEDLVMEALKSGIMIEVYSDGGYYAPSITIPNERFCNDLDAQRIFGSHDLHIAFTEQQSSRLYVPSYDKKALIGTIYLK